MAKSVRIIRTRIERTLKILIPKTKPAEDNRSLWKSGVGGGGIVEKRSDGYFFNKVPTSWRGVFKEGDRMPESWPLAGPANKKAREELIMAATAS